MLTHSIMNDNCILDKKKQIKIPQNKNKYFIIEKSKEWSNCIDILTSKEEIDVLNLFLIIKSYIRNMQFYCYKMSVIIVKKELKDTIITENMMLNYFLKASYWEFENWFMDRLHNDLKYITQKEDLYGFRIVFQSKIIEGLNKKYNEDVLKILKPIYPWKDDILKSYKIDLNEIEIIKEENQKLKKENEDNKDIIKKLVRELEEFKKST